MKLFLIVSILFSVNAHAKKYKKNAVDRAHRNFSNRVLRLSDDIDAFFADDEHAGLTNKSRLKISLSTRFREAAGPLMIPDMDYRLVLPRTEKKFRLFIENENEDTENETSETRIDKQNRDPNQDSSAAGVRYMIDKSGIKFYTDTGVIVDVPPKVFIRFTAKKKIPLDYWVLKIQEQLKWVNTEGFTSSLDLDFDKRLTRKYLLRMVNNTFWNDQDYVITFENGPSLFHKIDKKKALSYHAHVISVNKPNFLVTNYLLQITYRQELYGKWLFMNLTPFTNFPRERNFHRTPGFIIKFDAIFGHI